MLYCSWKAFASLRSRVGAPEATSVAAVCVGTAGELRSSIREGGWGKLLPLLVALSAYMGTKIGFERKNESKLSNRARVCSSQTLLSARLERFSCPVSIKSRNGFHLPIRINQFFKSNHRGSSDEPD